MACMVVLIYKLDEEQIQKASFKSSFMPYATYTQKYT